MATFVIISVFIAVMDLSIICYSLIIMGRTVLSSPKILFQFLELANGILFSEGILVHVIKIKNFEVDR